MGETLTNRGLFSVGRLGLVFWAAGPWGVGTVHAVTLDQAALTLPDTPWLVLGLVLLTTALAMGQNRLRHLKQVLLERQSRMEEALAQFRIMAGQSTEGILMVREFRVHYANEKALEILGLDRTAEPSDKVLDYVHSEDMGRTLEKLETLALTPDRETVFRLRLQGPEEAWIWVEARMISVTMDGVAGALIFLRDLSRLKGVELALRLNQRLEAMGVLARGIGHDFNNILTPIMCNAELAMITAGKEAPQRKELKDIYEYALRARDLVRHFRNLSQAPKGEKLPSSLGPMVKHGVELFKATLPATVNVTHHIAKNVPMVLVDPTLVYQAFMNLCTNAGQAMEGLEEAHLDIRLEAVVRLPAMDPEMPDLAPGEYVALSVSDNGSGVAPELRDRIFDPYFSTRSGTGLGLGVSRDIVRECRGELFLESSSETGSRFQILLPVYSRDRKSEVEYNLSQVPSPGQGNILFCDDEQDLTELVRQMFEGLGYNVLTASSGEEALEFIHREPSFFDLIITDLDMPGMCCETLIASIRRASDSIPLVICTGHHEFLKSPSLPQEDRMAYIAKPYSLYTLSALASRYISSPASVTGDGGARA